MDKKERKQLELQLSVTIAYFLKKTDETVASKMGKQIHSASKDLAKKFLKVKESIAEKAEKVLLKQSAIIKKSTTPDTKTPEKNLIQPKAKKTIAKKKTAAKKPVKK